MEEARQHTALTAAVAAIGLASAAVAQDVAVLPSGRSATALDVIAEDDLWRFRFVAPWVAGPLDPAAVEADLLALCVSRALPALPSPPPAEVVVSLSQRPVPFGEAAPDVVQMFELYRVADGRCVWQAF